MKVKATQRELKNSFKYIIEINFCELSYLLNYKEPFCYTSGDSWNNDNYKIDTDILVSTGYRPIKGIRPDRQIIKKYNTIAEKIFYKYGNTDKTKKITNWLVNRFCNTVITLHQQPKKPKFIAFYNFYYDSGIGILEFIYGVEDKVKYQYITGKNVSRILTSKIRYDKYGLAYFISHKTRYYLDNFIRTDL